MSKGPRKGSSKSGAAGKPPGGQSQPHAHAPAPAPSAPAPAESLAATAAPSWIDSSDPRKRLIGKIVLVGIWIYVAALWLLALDQTFNWGIFGPKTPPIP
jgi:hypothetical protein